MAPIKNLYNLTGNIIKTTVEQEILVKEFDLGMKKRGRDFVNDPGKSNSAGKSAEFAVMNLLKSQGINVAPPDTTVKAHGIWDADLSSEKYDFHIKVSLMTNIHSCCWWFKGSDPHTINPGPRDRFIFLQDITPPFAKSGVRTYKLCWMGPMADLVGMYVSPNMVTNPNADPTQKVISHVDLLKKTQS